MELKHSHPIYHSSALLPPIFHIDLNTLSLLCKPLDCFALKYIMRCFYLVSQVRHLDPGPFFIPTGDVGSRVITVNGN